MSLSATINGTSNSPKDVEMIINGVSRPSSTGTTFPVHNPLTGKFLYNAHSASAEDCREAVKAAEGAFKEWKEWSPSRRRLLFFRAADLFESQEWQAKIKERMSTETGANSNWIHPANTAGAAANLREVGSVATHIKGEVIPSDFPGMVRNCGTLVICLGTTVMLVRDPVGVVFAISPWNAPITLTLRAIATPLICGNTVVLKASEYSPLTQRTVVEALMEAGIPKGVVNFLMFSTQDAPARTEEIIAMRPVRRINFTGSDRVGRLIAQTCGKHLKQVISSHFSD
jgi:benzaldehyde dehydrogenase (NAD)